MAKKKRVNQWADQIFIKLDDVNGKGKWLYEIVYHEDKERISPTDDFDTPHAAWRHAVKKQKQIFKRNNYGTGKIKR